MFTDLSEGKGQVYIQICGWNINHISRLTLNVIRILTCKVGSWLQPKMFVDRLSKLDTSVLSWMFVRDLIGTLPGTVTYNRLSLSKELLYPYSNSLDTDFNITDIWITVTHCSIKNRFMVQKNEPVKNVVLNSVC